MWPDDAPAPAPPPAPLKAQTSPAPAPKPVAATPRPEPIRVFPSKATLLPGDPGVQLVVQGPGDHGGRRDLSAGDWKAEPEGIVAVEPGGYVRPLRPGTARVLGKDRAFAAEITVSADKPRTWDFAEDIEPILTRSGCNTGGCHGRGDGQNGFHLSLFGYDPEGDHRALTRDLGERRISKFQPQASLLLAKGSGTVPHVGGPRLRRGSVEYETLLAWIRAGTPYATEKNHGRIKSLAVEPADVRLDEPGDQQLRVVARYADGHERDVTRLASYRVNDDSVIAIDPARGKAKLLRRAEADLVVRYESQVVSARLATIINPGLKFDFAGQARRNFIDDELLKRLESLKVPPSPAAPDATFLRRVSLDLTGEQPRPEQVRDFLKDTDPEKRAKLVDSLLASSDFVLFWQLKLGDMLEISSGRPEFAGQPAITYANWVKKQLIDNTPWDAFVRTLLTSVGKIERDTGGPVAYALEGMDPKISAEKTAQRFLGLRIRCAQCHDHPFDVWTQDDYFGLAATFARVERSAGGMPGHDGMRTRTLVKSSTPRDRARTPPDPQAGPGRRSSAARRSSRPRVTRTLRARLRRLDHRGPTTPIFARAMANWAWSQLLRQGDRRPARRPVPVQSRRSTPSCSTPWPGTSSPKQVRPPRPDPDDRGVRGLRDVVARPSRATRPTIACSPTRCPAP